MQKHSQVPKPDSLDYKEGDRVSHIKFGKGTVLAVEDMKKDYQVTVEFDTAGVKNCLQDLQNLKRFNKIYLKRQR